MVEDGLQPLLDEALAGKPRTARRRSLIVAAASGRAGPGPGAVPACDRLRRALHRRGRRSHDRLPGRRPGQPGLRDARDMLLAAQGNPHAFPRVRNETIRLLREHEQETRFLLDAAALRAALGPAVDANRAQARQRRGRPRSTARRRSSATSSRPTTAGSPRIRRSPCSTRRSMRRARTSPRTKASIATAASRATSCIAPRPTCSRSSSQRLAAASRVRIAAAT